MVMMKMMSMIQNSKTAIITTKAINLFQIKNINTNSRSTKSKIPIKMIRPIMIIVISRWKK